LTFCSQSTLKVSIQSKMFFSLVLSLTQIYSKKSVTFFPPALLSNCSCIIFYFFTFSFTVALQLEWPAASSHRRALFPFFYSFFPLHSRPPRVACRQLSQTHSIFGGIPGALLLGPRRQRKCCPRLLLLPLMPRTHCHSVDHRPHFAGTLFFFSSLSCHELTGPLSTTDLISRARTHKHTHTPNYSVYHGPV
jgi:hypothetical protein